MIITPSSNLARFLLLELLRIDSMAMLFVAVNVKRMIVVDYGSACASNYEIIFDLKNAFQTHTRRPCLCREKKNTTNHSWNGCNSIVYVHFFRVLHRWYVDSIEKSRAFCSFISISFSVLGIIALIKRHKWSNSAINKSREDELHRNEYHLAWNRIIDF